MANWERYGKMYENFPTNMRPAPKRCFHDIPKKLYFFVYGYLKGKLQYVYLNGESSESKEITCGVPQGSVLGPLRPEGGRG